MSAASPGAGDYLRPGSDQARLVGRMANGHARFKHGADLGQPSLAGYQARVKKHLASARLGFAVTGTDRRPRYLIADTRTNQVAWITPHKEHRSTFFTPRQEISKYVRNQRAHNPNERWQSIDLDAERTRGTAAERRGERSMAKQHGHRTPRASTPRQSTQRITSASRAADPREPTR